MHSSLIIVRQTFVQRLTKRGSSEILALARAWSAEVAPGMITETSSWSRIQRWANCAIVSASGTKSFKSSANSTPFSKGSPQKSPPH